MIYGNAEAFPVGGSKVLRASGDDQCTVVAAGVTVHEALAAHDILKQQGGHVRGAGAQPIQPPGGAPPRPAQKWPPAKPTAMR